MSRFLLNRLFDSICSVSSIVGQPVVWAIFRVALYWFSAHWADLWDRVWKLLHVNLLVMPGWIWLRLLITGAQQTTWSLTASLSGGTKGFSSESYLCKVILIVEPNSLCIHWCMPVPHLFQKITLQMAGVHVENPPLTWMWIHVEIRFFFSLPLFVGYCAKSAEASRLQLKIHSSQNLTKRQKRQKDLYLHHIYQPYRKICVLSSCYCPLQLV